MTIYKATNENVKDLNITATQPVPDLSAETSKLNSKEFHNFWKQFHINQAAEIWRQMKESLPQGTRSQLFAIMAAEYADIFRVL